MVRIQDRIYDICWDIERRFGPEFASGNLTTEDGKKLDEVINTLKYLAEKTKGKELKRK